MHTNRRDFLKSQALAAGAAAAGIAITAHAQTTKSVGATPQASDSAYDKSGEFVPVS